MSATTQVNVGDATKASLINEVIENLNELYVINAVSSADYTVLDDDEYGTILVEAGSTGRTVTLPTAADNTHRTITIIKSDGTTAAVSVDGDSSETILSAGNDYANIELIQKSDFVQLQCDGTQWIKVNSPYWHRVEDPSTGWIGTKTGGWTADSFSGGMSVDFSNDVPTGTKAVRVQVHQEGTQSGVFYRPSGDTNISNGPSAAGEYSARILEPDDGIQNAELWLSTGYAAQIAVTNTATDIQVSYPTEYLL